MTFRRRDVEPLVRADEIDRHIAAARIHHAEFEHGVGAGGASPIPDNEISGISNRAMTSSPVLRAPSLPSVALALAGCPA